MRFFVEVLVRFVLALLDRWAVQFLPAYYVKTTVRFVNLTPPVIVQRYDIVVSSLEVQSEGRCKF